LKTVKLIIGIVSMVLFLIVAVQSCTFGALTSLTGIRTGGIAGMFLAVFMLVGGIVGVATRNSANKVGGIMAGGFYIIAAAIGLLNLGVFSYLLIWSAISLAFGLAYIVITVFFERRDEYHVFFWDWHLTRKIIQIILASIFLLGATIWLRVGLNTGALGSPGPAVLALLEVISLWVSAIILFVYALKFDSEDVGLRPVIIAISFFALSVLLVPINETVNNTPWRGWDLLESEGIQPRQRASSPGNHNWRQFLREYEEWVDDYILLLQRYQNNPLDLTLMSEYLAQMERLIEWSERADTIGDSLQNDPDAWREYFGTLTRILNKLSQIY
jgi:hypothetical protein